MGQFQGQFEVGLRKISTINKESTQIINKQLLHEILNIKI